METLAEFKQTPRSIGLSLRLDLADLIHRAAREAGLAGSDALAKHAGVRRYYIDRLTGGDKVPERVALQVLHRLGVVPRMVAGHEPPAAT